MTSSDKRTDGPLKMTVKGVLDDFASRTSMHGIPHVIGSLSTVSRCFWSLICIAAGVMVSMQMTVLMTRYLAYPKKVSLAYSDWLIVITD